MFLGKAGILISLWIEVWINYSLVIQLDVITCTLLFLHSTSFSFSSLFVSRCFFFSLFLSIFLSPVSRQSFCTELVWQKRHQPESKDLCKVARNLKFIMVRSWAAAFLALNLLWNWIFRTFFEAFILRLLLQLLCNHFLSFLLPATKLLLFDLNHTFLL